MSLIYLSFVWVAGILLGSKLDLPPALVLLGLVPLLLVLFVREHKKGIILASLCLITFFAGAVYYQFRLPSISERGLPWEWISALRDSLAEVLAKALPEPQASLAQGITLGIRENIPRSVQTDFVNTGTAHILAISGQNLSILAGILVSFGIWLFGRRHYVYIWLALVTLWLYALLTGMQPPVLRATIMASVFLAADLVGRQRSAFTALVFAAAVMVGASPRVLWEASFQMSFMAMAGLILIFPPIQSLGRRVVAARLGESGVVISAASFVVDSFGVSLGALIAVWPLIAYYFGIVSWAGPLATFFALPVFPGIIVSGVLTGFLGLIVLPAAQAVAWVAWLFLSYMLAVVKVFALVPHAEGVRIDSAFLWGYYSVLTLLVWLANDRRSMARVKDWLKSGAQTSANLFSRLRVRWVAPPLAVIAILVWVAVITLPDDNLHASFLDVGQGDATLFQKGSQQALIDGGPDEEAIMLALGKEMPFWDRTIDLVILTHPHADHIIGLLEVLKRYRVKQVVFTDYTEYDGLLDEAPLYDDWLELIKQKGIDSAFARAGQQVSFGSGVTIEVLNPQNPILTGAESDIDNNGVALRVGMGEVSFLITGDMRWQAESELITERTKVTSTVLKVAHHGSATSTSEGFLGAVNPTVAIISVGKGNPYSHPHTEVMSRLQGKLDRNNIYRTDERGRIELITDGVKLWVRTEK